MVGEREREVAGESMHGAEGEIWNGEARER